MFIYLFMSYAASFISIIMYCGGLFTYCKQHCLQTNMTSLVGLWISTFLQNFMPLSNLVFELWVSNLKKEKMNKTPYHSPIHL